MGPNLGPSANNPVIKGMSTFLKKGGPQNNPFQALRGQIEASTFEEHDAVVEGGVTLDFEKVGGGSSSDRVFPITVGVP